MFDYSIEKAINIQQLCQELHISPSIPGRVSQDSGAKVEYEMNPKINVECFGCFVKWATKFFPENHDYKTFGYITQLVNSANDVEFPLIRNWSKNLYNSQKQLLVFNYNGQRGIVRYSVNHQEKKFMDTLNTYDKKIIIIENEIHPESDDNIFPMYDIKQPNIIVDEFRDIF